MSLVVLGIGSILYGVLTGQVNPSNATFGIFDTLG